MPTPGQKQHLTLSFQFCRYGLVVRIPGSHPGGPGSIPGNGKLLDAICIICSKKLTTRMGFEPTRAEPIGLAVQRLNHSATSSYLLWMVFINGLKKKKLRRPGIEPGSTAWKAAMLTIIPPTLAHHWSTKIHHNSSF